MGVILSPSSLSVVPLQIMMAPILMEAAATPCHVEFMQYLTKRSLHVQQSIQKSSATPVPTPHPSGINLKFKQENPSSSRPKASDPDSPKPHPTPKTDPLITPSKPPVRPRKPEAMLSKISDASLRPPAMPKKCTLMPQKAVSGGSSNSAKDILDCITVKYVVWHESPVFKCVGPPNFWKGLQGDRSKKHRTKCSG